MNGLQAFLGGHAGLGGNALGQVSGAPAPVPFHSPQAPSPERMTDAALDGVSNIEGGRPIFARLGSVLALAAARPSVSALRDAFRADYASSASQSSSVGDVFAAPAPKNGTQRAVPVLCPSSVQTLYVCAGPAVGSPRPAATEFANHPVLMPDARSERGQVCNDIVGGSLIGTDGRNGTSVYEVVRSDVAKSVGDTARRWTGKPDLVGKKEWERACLVREPVHSFVSQVNQRLHEGKRTLPAADATEWMLRVALSTGSPMQQAMARTDLPATVAVCSNDWAKLALGIEQTGDAHWGMRHTDVMQSARLPQTNTPSFMALATSMHTSLRPEVACLRLRNEMTALGVPTQRALSGDEDEVSYEYPDA